MPRPEFDQHPAHLSEIRRAALAAADAERAVQGHLSRDGSKLQIGARTLTLDPGASIYLIALGKAAPAMTRAAASVLGDRLSEGIATLPLHRGVGQADRSVGQPPTGVRYIVGEHPLPGPGSLKAGEAAAMMLAQTQPRDLLLTLVSGGGSALMELLLPGITLSDLRRLNEQLLASGMQIQDINHVRTAISRLKGGGLARIASPAQVASLILSDVVGDPLSSIASGPTVLRRRSRSHARSLLQERGLWSRVPSRIRRALERGAPPLRKSRRPYNLLVGSNRQVVHAAAAQAVALGFAPRVLSLSMQGEAQKVGDRFARRLLRARPGSCLLMGGETTVQLRRSGRGGRNQELALAAALRLENMPGAAVLSLATDGVDGPTDAAGAAVSGFTSGAIRAAGIDPEGSLRRHDSYPALNAAEALVRTGPTGTNLNDLVVGLRYKSS